MASEHTYKEYDNELESVRAKVLEMGGIVEEQLVNAIEALVKSDPQMAQSVMDSDQRVNELEIEVDEDCSRIIARRQPAAGDLRMIMMILKTITDLERIGDEATKIARTALRIIEDNRMTKLRFSEVKTMVEVVRQMLRTSLDSFARMDVSKTVEIAKKDELVDEQYRSTIRQLVTFMLEDPRTISMSLEVMFVAKAIERIGDHAKNISEYIVYTVKGKDIRHASIKEIQKTIKE
jgi:phosphate transport system protein